MYIYVYVHICIYIYIYVCMYIHIFIHTSVVAEKDVKTFSGCCVEWFGSGFRSMLTGPGYPVAMVTIARNAKSMWIAQFSPIMMNYLSGDRGVERLERTNVLLEIRCMPKPFATFILSDPLTSLRCDLQAP